MKTLQAGERKSPMLKRFFSYDVFGLFFLNECLKNSLTLYDPENYSNQCYDQQYMYYSAYMEGKKSNGPPNKQNNSDEIK
jgi:hypothetical protein